MSKFEQLMDKILKSCDGACQLREKLERKLADLQSEVTSAQEKASQELAQKISKSFYQFQQKKHERQFNFNASVQESIATAKNKLAKMVPAGEREKEALKKATDSLDEGAKALTTRQKHIQLADRSEYGWSTVKYYKADPLASYSDDEKVYKDSWEGSLERDREEGGL